MQAVDSSFGFESELDPIKSICISGVTLIASQAAKKSLLAHIKEEILLGIQNSPLQNPECCSFIVLNRSLNIYDKDFSIVKTFNSAASLAAACWMIANQSQVRSMQHIACNPSNLFWSVTGERMRGGYQRVFWGCCTLFTTGFHIVLMLIRSLNRLHRHPRGSLKSDNTSIQRLDCVCLHIRGNNDDVKGKGMYCNALCTF